MTPQSERKADITQQTLHVPFPASYTYANVIALSISMMDIRIGFGEAMDQPRVESRVGVVLPPETAAYLVLTLFRQLLGFELNFGQIRHPQWREFMDCAEGPLATLKKMVTPQAASPEAPATETTVNG